jgi:hypothetical protein
MSRFRLIAVLSTLATALLAPSAASADTAVQDLLFQYNLSNLRQQGARPVAATSLIQLTAANAVMTGNRTKACRGHSKRTVWWARYGPRANQRTYKVCRSKHQVVVAKPARLGPKLKLRSLMRADLLTTLEALKRPTAHLPKEDAWITQVTGMVFPLSVVPSPKGLAIVLPCLRHAVPEQRRGDGGLVGLHDGPLAQLPGAASRRPGETRTYSQTPLSAIWPILQVSVPIYTHFLP